VSRFDYVAYDDFAKAPFHPPRRASSNASRIPPQAVEIHIWRKRGFKVYQGSATSKWVHVAGRRFYRSTF
jgi:hypothetical protein